MADALRALAWPTCSQDVALCTCPQMDRVKHLSRADFLLISWLVCPLKGEHLLGTGCDTSMGSSLLVKGLVTHRQHDCPADFMSHTNEAQGSVCSQPCPELRGGTALGLPVASLTCPRSQRQAREGRGVLTAAIPTLRGCQRDAGLGQEVWVGAGPAFVRRPSNLSAALGWREGVGGRCGSSY